MAKVTVQQWLQNWQQGISSKTSKITQGIQSVTVAPGQKAAQKSSAMLAGVTAAVTSGKWAERVSSVSLSDWQTATAAKVGNIATGAANAVKSQRVQQNVAQALADNDAALAAIANMPSDTVDQRIQRSVAYQQERARLAAQRG